MPVLTVLLHCPLDDTWHPSNAIGPVLVLGSTVSSVRCEAGVAAVCRHGVSVTVFLFETRHLIMRSCHSDFD